MRGGRRRSSLQEQCGDLTVPVFDVSALLHDLTTKQEIVMEQQMSLIKMVQDLQANNVREVTDADRLNQRRFPIEDLSSLTALENDLRSCPETRRKVVGNSQSCVFRCCHHLNVCIMLFQNINEDISPLTHKEVVY